MKTITKKDLIALLDDIKGATFATIVTDTDARLKKTGNPFRGPVRKVSTVNVTLGFQYESSVNRQRAREDAEPDFKAEPRQWGKRVTPILVMHKGRIYLETKVERSQARYVDAAGWTLDNTEVRPFLPSRGKSRQGVNREVIVRDYSLDSIRSISMKGEQYILIAQPKLAPSR